MENPIRLPPPILSASPRPIQPEVAGWEWNPHFTPQQMERLCQNVGLDPATPMGVCQAPPTPNNVEEDDVPAPSGSYFIP